jgi:predicted ATPase
VKIKKLHIKNFKSLVDLEIVEPNPFTVFVGANGVGKSNIFEALEFANFLYSWNPENAVRLFGGNEYIKTRVNPKFARSDFDDLDISFEFEEFYFLFQQDKGFSHGNTGYLDNLIDGFLSSEDVHEPWKREPGQKENYTNYLHQFVSSSNRIFIKNDKLVRVREIGDEKLGIDCSNLEKVLKRLLNDENTREEILEWLRLLIPGFEKVEIRSDNIGGTDTLLVYEKYIEKPFNKDLISDGTFNLICLLTAIYQSDEPQFLCIEEPENGLTPDVIKEMVILFRNACEEKGHYIWLNTHSQTLVSQLTSDEIITVDKVKGETKIKQFKGKDFHGLRMDEAWLTNSLGSGLPW